MKCYNCEALKSWYHGTESDPGNFSYTCGLSGLSVDPDGPTPEWCQPPMIFLDPADDQTPDCPRRSGTPWRR